MSTPTVMTLAALLTAVGPVQFEDVFAVAAVTVTGGEHGAELITYDSQDTPIGVIVVAPDDDGGGATLTADFDDGYVETTGATVSTLPGDVVESRMAAIADALKDAPPVDIQRGYFTCGVAAVGTVAACATLRLVCPLGIIATMCTCSEAFDVPVECW